MKYISIIVALSLASLGTTTIGQTNQITKGKIYTPGSVSNFNDVLQNYDLIVVDFYADWCQPCVQMHKVIDALAQDHDLDSILFVKINTEVYRSLANEYQIYSLPTIVLFVDGKAIKTVYGLTDKKMLKKIIKDTFLIPKNDLIN
jgi:thioredoxin